VVAAGYWVIARSKKEINQKKKKILQSHDKIRKKKKI
jgi:hypothetical protein